MTYKNLVCSQLFLKPAKFETVTYNKELGFSYLVKQKIQGFKQKLKKIKIVLFFLLSLHDLKITIPAKIMFSWSSHLSAGDQAQNKQ